MIEEHERTLRVRPGDVVRMSARVENHQAGRIKVWIQQPNHPPSLIDDGNFEVSTELGLGIHLIGKLLLIRTNAVDVLPQTDRIQIRHIFEGGQIVKPEEGIRPEETWEKTIRLWEHLVVYQILEG